MTLESGPASNPEAPGASAEDHIVVRGLFIRDGQPIKASFQAAEDAAASVRRYDLVIGPELLGAESRIPMWDGSELALSIPKDDAKPGRILFNAEYIKLVITRWRPHGKILDCYYGKETLPGGLRVTVCHLQGPHLYFGITNGREVLSTASRRLTSQLMAFTEGQFLEQPTDPLVIDVKVKNDVQSNEGRLNIERLAECEKNNQCLAPRQDWKDY